MVKVLIPISAFALAQACEQQVPSLLKNGQWVHGWIYKDYFSWRNIKNGITYPPLSGGQENPEFNNPGNAIDGVVHELTCGWTGYNHWTAANTHNWEIQGPPKDHNYKGLNPPVSYGNIQYVADIDAVTDFAVDQIKLSIPVWLLYQSPYYKFFVGEKDANGEFSELGECQWDPSIPNGGGANHAEVFFDCNGMQGDMVKFQVDERDLTVILLQITVSGGAVVAPPVLPNPPNPNIPTTYQDFIGTRADGNMPVCQRQLNSHNMCGMWLNCIGQGGGAFTRHCPTTCDKFALFYPKQMCQGQYRLGQIRSTWFRTIDTATEKKACYKRGGPNNPNFAEVCVDVDTFLDF